MKTATGTPLFYPNPPIRVYFPLHGKSAFSYGKYLVSRENTASQLNQGIFDILVIGGGATGSGVALDAVSRGLRVALVEKNDFGSETSSRSTKLLHGGVRYLEQAVLNFQWSQYALVRDALSERQILIQNAPHLCRPFPLLTPIYALWSIPYFTCGLKLYDNISGRRSLGHSFYEDAKQTLAHAPHLKKEGLRGSVVYYDGQFDDARMNLSLILTAVEKGAVILNYAEVVSLSNAQGKLTGATVRDRIHNRPYEVRARIVVNATGAFADSIRKMDNPNCRPMITTSSGTHLVLPRELCPTDYGVLIPKTEDGRVLFMLPWMGYTLAGTTDYPCELSANPKPTDQEIQYLLHHLSKHFTFKIDESHILSSWSGIRPLISAKGHGSDTAHLSRDHHIQLSPTGLITIGGGKWTTYRLMARDTVNKAVEVGDLQTKLDSQTESLKLVGAKDYREEAWKDLTKKLGMESGSAKHLHHNYGDRAPLVAEMAAREDFRKWHKELPFLDAEIDYAVLYEMALSPVDILARRTRLAFLNKNAALQCLPKVAERMARILGWNQAETHRQQSAAFQYLNGKTHYSQKASGV